MTLVSFNFNRQKIQQDTPSILASLQQSYDGQLTDVSRRVSSSFSCGITCPPGAYGPYFDFLGGSYTASALASSQVIWYYNDGYGNVAPFSSYANVISDNSAVALADDKGFGWLDTTAGILGSANLNYLYQSYEKHFDGQDCYSSNSQQYPESAGMTAGPDIGPYSEDDIDSLEGTLVGFDAINADGSISKASLDPEAYEYLVAQGFLDSGAVIRTIEVAIEQSQGAPPQYRVIVVVTVLVAAAVGALIVYARRTKPQNDPLVIRNERAISRLDQSGTCLGPGVMPIEYKWMEQNLTGLKAGATHWHWLDWNFSPAQCNWFFTRQEGQTIPDHDIS